MAALSWIRLPSEAITAKPRPAFAKVRLPSTTLPSDWLSWIAPLPIEVLFVTPLPTTWFAGAFASTIPAANPSTTQFSIRTPVWPLTRMPTPVPLPVMLKPAQSRVMSSAARTGPVPAHTSGAVITASAVRGAPQDWALALGASASDSPPSDRVRAAARNNVGFMGISSCSGHEDNVGSRAALHISPRSPGEPPSSSSKLEISSTPPAAWGRAPGRAAPVALLPHGAADAHRDHVVLVRISLFPEVAATIDAQLIGFGPERAEGE